MPTPVIRTPKIRDVDDMYQRDARKAVKDISAQLPSRSVVRGVVLGATTVLVPHQLGKQPIAWQITDQTAQADIWRDSTQATTTDKIPLKASATVTVDIQFW